VRFGSSAKQDHENRTSLYVINPVPGTIVDAHFAQPANDRLYITRVSTLKAANAGDNPGDSSPVFLAVHPFGESCTLDYLDRV
jgi:hypothetical protein